MVDRATVVLFAIYSSFHFELIREMIWDRTSLAMYKYYNHDENGTKGQRKRHYKSSKVGIKPSIRQLVDIVSWHLPCHKYALHIGKGKKRGNMQICRGTCPHIS